MKTHRRTARALVAGSAAITLLLPMAAFAAEPSASGGETGTTGSDYSDLVVLLRADDGTPVLKKYVVPADLENPATVEYCVQPVSYDPIPGVAATTSAVDGTAVYAIPLQGEWLDPAVAPVPLPVAEIEPCDAQPAFGMFVAEVELERLNMARTADRVLADKIAAVETKLLAADTIDLDPAGRIRLDGVPIDAAPEHAGIYQSLMYNGTIPGLPADKAGPPALVGPTPEVARYNSQFDAWELAAAAVGTAASKGVPITIDTIEYYNQVIGFPPEDYVPLWNGVNFLRSYDPDSTTNAKLPTGRRYVDYSGFSYTRADTFPGSVTWLDVLALEWRVSPILDAVDFTNPAADTETLHGVEAFKQLADDTRSVILYLHDNEVILPGFFMDSVGTNTIEAQQAAVRDPAVSLGALPTEVFQGMEFGITASLFNPHTSTPVEDGGSLIDHARLRVTIDAADALDAADVTAASTSGEGPLTFTPSGDNLVGWWGPEAGFDVPPGYHDDTTFTVTIADESPTGDYTMKLELVDLDTDAVRATDQGIVKVNDNVTTVVWGGEVPTLATQGSYLTVPLRVYAPDALPATLRLAVTGPPAPEVPLAAGDVNVYASNGLTMVEMPLALDTGKLVGTWPLTTEPNDYKNVTWYVRFREGAPEGGYALDINLVGGNALDTALIAVVAPEAHGEKTDQTPPDVKVETVDTLGTDASFILTTVVAEDGVTYSCRLTKDDVVISDWKNCTDGDSGSVTYTGLAPGNYVFSGRAFDAAGNGSDTLTRSWVVTADTGSGGGGGGDTTPPMLQVDTVGTLGGSSASFTLGTSPAGDAASYACLLTKDDVAGAWEPCGSGSKTYSDLEEGSYVFSATATDAVGNVSSVVTIAWHVYDTEAPVVLVEVDGTLGTSARFTLTTAVAEDGVTYECRLAEDDVASVWENCTSGSSGVRSYTDLEPGAYVFSGRATDTAGNASEVVTESWSVPRAGGTPETKVVAGPKNLGWVLARTARFELGSDADGAQFRVTVNGQKTTGCASEECFVDVRPGRNRIKFAAKVGDSVDPTPAVRTVFVPRSSHSLKHSAGWRLREGDAHLFGQYAETRQQGEVLKHWFGNVRRVALVASTGPDQGRVHVYLGKTRLTAKAIDLSRYTERAMRLIEVRTLTKARSGMLRIVVVSDGDRVRVDGVGIATR